MIQTIAALVAGIILGAGAAVIALYVATLIALT